MRNALTVESPKRTSTRLFSLLSALSLFLASAPCSAQTPQADSVQSKVTVYVSLHGKGKTTPIAKADQLVISDAGTPIDSSAVEIASGPPAQEPVLSVVFDRMSSRGYKNSALMTNDLLPHLAAQSFKVAVWGVQSRLEVVQPYTDNLSTAEQAIKQFASAAAGKHSTGANTPPPATPAGEAWSTAVLTAAAQFVTEHHASWTYAALLASAQQQKKRAGRQAILLFTEEQDIDRNPAERYPGLLEKLKDSNTLLVLIDANLDDNKAREQMIAATAMGAQQASNYYSVLAGMHSTLPFATTMNLPPLTFARMQDTIHDIQMDALGKNGNALARLAESSGGAYTYTGGSTKQLSRELIESLTRYTTITYISQPGQRDGRYHPVSIRSTAPGLAIGTQPGYFATRPMQATVSVSSSSPISVNGTGSSAQNSATARQLALLDRPAPAASLADREAASAADTDKDNQLTGARALNSEAGLTARADISLSPSQSNDLLAEARANALTYADKLPNFMCQEVINRSVDPAGDSDWKARDSILENLQFQDGNEKHSILKVNGEKSSLAADSLDGTRSNGEFGNLLKIIFEPSVQAAFEWSKTDQRNGETLQVFRFKVALDKSQFTLKDRNNAQTRAGIHGLLYIDGATHAVRRLFLQTDPLPHDFDVRSSWIVMNYDPVQINGHEYLLPSHGEVGLIQGKHEIFLNAIEFSAYHRFGSRSRVRFADPLLAEQP